MTRQVTDLFDGTSGVDLSAHTPDVDVVGGGWAQGTANSPELDGSGAAIWNVGTVNAYIDAGTTDSWIIAPLYLGGADNRGGVEARHDGSVYASRTCYLYNTLVGNSTQLFIYRVASGSFNLVASGNPTTSLVNTGTYSLEPETNGSSLDFIIDGASELSATNTVITTGNYVSLLKLLHTNTAYAFQSITVDDAAPSTGVTVEGVTDVLTLAEGTSDVAVNHVVEGITDVLTLAEGTADVAVNHVVEGVTDVLTLAEGTADVVTGGAIVVEGVTDVLTLAEGTADVVVGAGITVNGVTDVLTLTEGTSDVAVNHVVEGVTDVLTLTEGTASIITKVAGLPEDGVKTDFYREFSLIEVERDFTLINIERSDLVNIDIERLNQVS